MRYCFQLARRGEGMVSPNPMVGAVLVHEDRIIGAGWHQQFGGPHAEAMCYNAVKPQDRHKIPSSTLYCNLEPCAHFGKTPPCVDLVVRMKTPRVVISNQDPNPLVSGKSVEKMRLAGIQVQTGLLEEEGAWLNRSFFTWINRKRPYVILKWAETADGYIAAPEQRTEISTPATRRLVHRWRAASDAVLVGANTALIDNPILDARYFNPTKRPLRVLLDARGQTPNDFHLLADDGPTLVFGFKPNAPAAKEWINTTGPAQVEQVLSALYDRQKAMLLVEGGAMVHQQFLESGHWDEIRIIRNEKQLQAGVAAPKRPRYARLYHQITIGKDTISYWLNPESEATLQAI